MNFSEMKLSLTEFIMLLQIRDCNIKVIESGKDYNVGDEWIHFSFSTSDGKKLGYFSCSSRNKKLGNNLVVRDVHFDNKACDSLNELSELF